MKVLIANSYSNKSNAEAIVRLAPLYLCAVLKMNDVFVKHLDVENDKDRAGSEFNIERYCEEIIKPLLNDFQPEVVGISVHYSGAFLGAVQLAKYIKSITPGTIIVVGGHHPTVFGRLILERYGEIDYVLKGEAEATFIELIKALQLNKGWQSIDGLVFRDNGKVMENDKSRFISDLDSIPFPDYDSLEIEKYQIDTSGWFNPKKQKIDLSFPLLTSRSCPNQCSFCSMSAVHGPRFRARSANNVVNEIEKHYRKYHQKYFSIVDDNFTLIKDRVFEMCDLIRGKGLDIQFDAINGMEINHVTKEIMDALIGIGFIRTTFSIESGSEYIRTEIIKKNLAQSKIYDVFDALKAYDGRFDYKALFVIGFPQETRETLEETRKIINDLGLKKVAIGYAIPYPGTELFAEALENKLLTVSPEILLEYPYLFNHYDKPLIKPYNVNAEDLIRFRQEVYAEVNKRNNYKAKFY